MNSVNKNLLIIGGGTAGKMVIDDLRENSRLRYNIVGVIDDKKKDEDLPFTGIRVLGKREDIPSVCKEYNVDEILLAIPSLTPKERAEIICICSSTLCRIKVLPSMSEIIDTNRIKNSVRNVQVEDLLARDPIVLNNSKISGYILGKTILVTGGGGSIGSELCRQIARFKPEKLIVLDIYENNAYDLQNELKYFFPDLDLEVVIASIRDKDRMEKIFEKYRPNIVFHAAAHKHVPLMESNPSEAVMNNVYGTMVTAKCAEKYNVGKFILISTDKAVNPTNVMGATKRLCEMIIQSMSCNSKTEFAAVRFGNVLGSNGSVVPLFKNQIRNGGPITLTHKDITRFFMTIPEAAQLVLDAASFAFGGEIYVLDMGKPIRIYDLALNLIKLSGLEPYKDINIEITGLRSGEKLFEEILMDEEQLFKTENNKIFVAKPIKIDFCQFEKGLIDLIAVATSHTYSKIRKTLAELVCTYTYESSPDEINSCTFEAEIVSKIKRRVSV